jgi:hypothetical protein
MRTDEIVYSPYPFLDQRHMVLLKMDIVVNSQQKPPQYNLYVGNNTKRIFSPSSLPKFIQLKLAMINSINKEKWNAFLDSDEFYELDCYLYNNFILHNPEFKHIGWQVSDSIYVIVLNEDELTQLKGTTVDTRKESQIKSQANS